MGTEKEWNGLEWRIRQHHTTLEMLPRPGAPRHADAARPHSCSDNEYYIATNDNTSTASTNVLA